MNENRKTRSNAKPFATITLLVMLLTTVMACSWSTDYAINQTATAAFWEPAAVTVEPALPAAKTETSPSSTNLSAPIPQPTNTPYPTFTSQAVIPPTPTQETLSITPTPEENLPPILYYAQAGDTLRAVAARFDVWEGAITSPDPIPETAIIKPNQLLIIPRRFSEDETTPDEIILPDSEIVFSPSSVDFDVEEFVRNAGGYLNEYKEWRTNGWNTGIEVIETVAIENSINPRLLLAILEYESNWVYGQPTNLAETDYPMGWKDFHLKGLYRQLSWAVQQFSIGYYGWRGGLITELEFPNEQTMRIAPEVNAGTVALQYLFSKLNNPEEWGGDLYSPDSVVALYEDMFGNPWTRAQAVEPLLPINLTQPKLELPFQPGLKWSLTGGPHSAWGPDGALAALDFAPAAQDHGCVESDQWVTAAASGLVVRSENGVVMVDLDGDGREQTGWALLYMHIATKDRVPVGTWVSTNDRIGHPSCEGGVANGTHVHFARKYNGEWVLADGPLPFVLSGWQACNGELPYEGRLVNGDQTVIASQYGSYESLIARSGDIE